MGALEAVLSWPRYSNHTYCCEHSLYLKTPWAMGTTHTHWQRCDTANPSCHSEPFWWQLSSPAFGGSTPDLSSSVTGLVCRTTHMHTRAHTHTETLQVHMMSLWDWLKWLEREGEGTNRPATTNQHRWWIMFFWRIILIYWVLFSQFFTVMHVAKYNTVLSKLIAGIRDTLIQVFLCSYRAIIKQCSWSLKSACIRLIGFTSKSGKVMPGIAVVLKTESTAHYDSMSTLTDGKNTDFLNILDDETIRCRSVTSCSIHLIGTFDCI